MTENRWPHDSAEAWRPYEPSPKDPWDSAKVLSMHRRAGFGATWREAQRDLADGYETSVRRVLEGAAEGPNGRPAAAIETFASAMFASYRTQSSLDSLRGAWFYRMIFSPWPLRERMILAWHDHYATSETRVYERTDLVEQHSTQRELWRGPMSKLHLAMLRDRAMLRWLDGASNQRGMPNENLGREFLELFALGVGNYGEPDVRDAARALTGWQYVSERTPPLKYMTPLHDAGEKIILGQKGAWSDEDLVRITCAHPAAARRIAWRLWRTFVSNVDHPTPELLEGLAATMRVDGDVDVGRGLETLLRSRLFHSDSFAGRRVLSPVEWTVGVARAGETFPPHPPLAELAGAAERMGQRLFRPPNVAGWPGGVEWLTAPALVARENFVSWLTGADSTVPADHWQKLSAAAGATARDAEIDLWCQRFWGRSPNDEQRASLAASSSGAGANDHVRLVAAVLNAAEAQVA